MAKSSDVNSVAAAIKKELPGATILTSKQLAGQVNGSLSNAKKLASDLGVALGIIILIAALLIALLLTLSSIAKRVREIGTLRAIGWSRGRVVRQILAEMLGIGIVGRRPRGRGGSGRCAAVNAFGPTLTYTAAGAQVGASRPAASAQRATRRLAAAHQVDQTAHLDLGPDRRRGRRHRHRRRSCGRSGRRLAGGAAVARLGPPGPRMTPDTGSGDAPAEGEGDPWTRADTPGAGRRGTALPPAGVERRYMKGEAEVAALRGVDLDITRR